MNFSDRIRAVAGDQPFAWAHEKGIPKGTMTVWLSGATPQKKSLQRLEEITGIPAEWWRRGEGPPPKRVDQAVDLPVDAIAMSPGPRDALNSPLAQAPSRHARSERPVPAREGAEEGAQESPDVAPQQADPTEADRRMMFLSLLRTMEHHLQAPVSRARAELMLEVVAAWSEFAAATPDLRARLEAVRVAACLYLDAALDRRPK